MGGSEREKVAVTSSLRIIVTGLIAQHPWLGGVAWDYIQYISGLARLGHDVYYFEDTGEWPYNLDGGKTDEDWVAYDCTANVNYLSNIMSRFGLGDKWAYYVPTQSRWFGLADSERRAVLQSADLLINVSGTLVSPEDYRGVPRLVYIDSDPVFTQVKLARGEADFCARVAMHDVHFSFGERLSSAVPETPYRWQATRQPIVLSEWRPSMPHRDRFTTVMNWTSYQPLTYAGQLYGQKDMEFLQFLDLPSQVAPAVLEVALSKTQHANWQQDITMLPSYVRQSLAETGTWSPYDLLHHMGWQVVDPIEICPDLDSYRHYIESSKGEWSVAKNGYVMGQPGWFSCRTACYLAAGRPAVVQDTGFTTVLPVGEGILAFRTLEEATAAVHEVNAHYPRHAKVARDLAQAYFDSDTVLSQLLEEVYATVAT
jgi:hypothetical protein